MSESTAVSDLVLRPRRALPFYSRHPWVFAGALAGEPADLPAGSAVRLRADDGRFVAYGLYNPASQIRVRLYSWDESQPLTDELWRARLTQAVDLRTRLFDAQPASRACRLVFSEGDQLSGLTVDRYGDWLCLQWTSRALQALEPLVLDQLQRLLQPKGIWRRTEKGIGEEEQLVVADGLLAGAEPPRPLFIEEHGVRLGVDLVQGHKTGCYFDQRRNRQLVARYCRDARVLDGFSYTGGFGLAAIVNGAATQVLCVDSSAPALEIAQANAELNSVGNRLQTVRSDVVPYLQGCVERSETFDVVIVDPPKMARSRGGLERAVQGYLRLNRLAIQCVTPGGILASCSCSGLVDTDTFLDLLARAAVESGRSLQLLEIGRQAEDHPVSAHCRESDYLKCVIARVL